MPTLEDWLALEHTEETPLMVRLFELRPEWLATGKLEDEVLVWFDSDWPGLPLYLDYEEFTLGWNAAHEHLLWEYGHAWPPVDIVRIAIERIEAILTGRLLRLYVETPAGEWRTFGFITKGELAEEIGKHEAQGLVVTINRWPGPVVYKSGT